MTVNLLSTAWGWTALALAMASSTTLVSSQANTYVPLTVVRTLDEKPGILAAKMCRDTLLNACPTQNDFVACVQCARENEAALRGVECTVQVIKAVCENREGVGIDNSDDTGDGNNTLDNSQLPLPIPPTVLPPGTNERPLQIIITSGQSNCIGQASAPMMEEDENPSYDNLKGTQEGVWFAGFQGNSRVSQERFFIGPMVAGEASKTRGRLFGPEVGIGSRIYEAREKASDVLVIKYGWGGSNIFREWNPRTDENNWDRQTDDGTAKWLLEESGGATALGDKKHLYANLIYTVRRTLEALDKEGVVYELAGMFWLQGSADKKVSTWKEYGEDIVALFEAIRTDLEAPTLPIVDQGILYHNINTGKNYAASVINGCNYIVAEMSFAAPNPNDSCLPGAGNICPDSTFINWDVFEYFGYDPAFALPEFADRKPPGATDKLFYWFKEYPINQHGEYEYDIMVGRSMANAYIRTFTNHELRSEWLLEDINEQFPMSSCDPDVNDGKPNNENVCWMDQRDDAALEEATCGLVSNNFVSDNAISAGSRDGSNVLFLLLTWLGNFL